MPLFRTIGKLLILVILSVLFILCAHYFVACGYDKGTSPNYNGNGNANGNGRY